MLWSCCLAREVFVEATRLYFCWPAIVSVGSRLSIKNEKRGSPVWLVTKQGKLSRSIVASWFAHKIAAEGTLPTLPGNPEDGRVDCARPGLES